MTSKDVNLELLENLTSVIWPQIGMIEFSSLFDEH